MLEEVRVEGCWLRLDWFEAKLFWLWEWSWQVHVSWRFLSVVLAHFLCTQWSVSWQRNEVWLCVMVLVHIKQVQICFVWVESDLDFVEVLHLLFSSSLTLEWYVTCVEVVGWPVVNCWLMLEDVRVEGCWLRVGWFMLVLLWLCEWIGHVHVSWWFLSVMLAHFLCTQWSVSWQRNEVWLCMIVFVHIEQVQICFVWVEFSFGFVGPGLLSMSPHSSSRDASHRGDSFGWQTEKMVWGPLAWGRVTSFDCGSCDVGMKMIWRWICVPAHVSTISDSSSKMFRPMTLSRTE